jgi:hypothetical protein
MSQPSEGGQGSDQGQAPVEQEAEDLVLTEDYFFATESRDRREYDQSEPEIWEFIK